MNKLGHKVLLRRAQDYIEKYHPLLIGVAGRLNQTITKQAISLVLSHDRAVHTMPTEFQGVGSVVSSLLGVNHKARSKSWWRLLIGSRVREVAEPEPDTHIVELGPGVPGDMDTLATSFSFFVGVITGVPTHALELFVDKKIMAHELQSLIIQLPRQGYAILNIDDPLVAAMAEKTVAHIITYGSSGAADVRLVRSKRVQQGIAVEIEIDSKNYEIYLAHVTGKDQVLAALAGLAVAKALQIDIQKALQQLIKLEPEPGHLNFIPALNDARILDASYDATPEDMLSALEALEELPARRKISVLGLFNNLGNQTRFWNEQLASKAGKISHGTILVGDDIPEARKAALAAGSDVHHFKTSIDAGKWLADYVHSGDLILVNGVAELALEETVFRLLPENERNHVALARKVKFA